MTVTSYRMSREQVDAFLAAPRHAIIAAGPAGGESQLSPVWYLFEESRLYFSSLVRSANPVLRYLELIGSAIAAGRAHIASPDGEEPHKPEAWGWRLTVVGSAQNESHVWRPQGDRIGWIDEGELYLDPSASYRAAQAMAGPAGEGIPVGERTLWKRLHEQGGLVVTDSPDRATVKRTLGGCARRGTVVEAGPGATGLRDLSDGREADAGGDDRPQEDPAEGDQGEGAGRG